jgi:serine/threonine-protein kinase
VPPSLSTGERPTTADQEASSQLGFPGSGQFGDYELLELIAQGGMGVVYRARDRQLGRIVALKMIRSGSWARVEEVLRFQREARAVAQLAHPNIVPLYEVKQFAGVHFFTMAFIGGGSLAQCLSRYPNEPRAAVILMEKIARAIHHAHEQGILHRDLKPGNILLDERNEPLVSDFGLAKLLDAGPDLTRSGVILGTPAYMAPEQATGRDAQIGACTDIWALGVILYELLTGQRPFDGKSREELTPQILESDPPRPRTVRPRLDRTLETICLKCLEKEPGRRYGSAGALADDLSFWLRGEAIRARPEGWLRRGWRKFRRHPLAAAGVVLLLLAAVILPTISYYTDANRPIRELEAQLTQQERVTLVPELGQPRWSRHSLGPSVLGHEGNPAKPLLLKSLDFALLELLPRTPCKNYRLEAEVRHDSTTRLGLVGIGFGVSKHQAPEGELLWLLEFGFDDCESLRQPPGGGPPGSAVSLSVWLVQGADRHKWEGETAINQFYVPPNSLTEKPWRRLAVELRPSTLDLFWEDTPLGTVPLADLQKPVQTIARVRAQQGFAQTPLPRFGANEGVGLCVRRGSASFRRVELQPFD